MSDARLAITSVGSEEEAERIARALVDERLAACVNIVAGVQSVYRWKNHVEKEREWLLLIKTTGSRMAALEKRIKQLHSYELPEFLVLPAEGGSAEYLAWIAFETALLS